MSLGNLGYNFVIVFSGGATDRNRLPGAGARSDTLGTARSACDSHHQPRLPGRPSTQATSYGPAIWLCTEFCWMRSVQNASTNFSTAFPSNLSSRRVLKITGAAAGILAHRIVLSTLAGRTESLSDLARLEADETTFLRSCEERHLTMAICFYKILKAQALYLFGRPKQALDATREIDGMLSYIVNHPNLADQLLYQSLSLTALWDEVGSTEAQAAMQLLQTNLAQLKVWSESCPDNFLAKRLMVEAEMARITGDESAIELYDLAVDAARKGEFVQDEALANELAARFVMERRPTSRVGAMYLRDARYAYLLWGAKRKVEELEIGIPAAPLRNIKTRVAFANETVQPSTFRSDPTTSISIP